MSAAQFTAGPWRVDKFKPCDVIAGDDYFERTFVAFAGRGTDIPSEANAKLIAAAPDLYEALRKCRSLLLPKVDQALAAEVDAALAKAMQQ